MSNYDLVKNTMIFILGGIAGGLITYKVMEDRIMARADEEIEEMRKFTREQISNSSKKKESAEKQMSTYKRILKDQGISVYGDDKEELTVKEKNMEEKDITRQTVDGDIVEDIPDVEPISGSDTEVHDEPFIIDQDQFIHSNSHYAKSTVIFFKLNDLLVDEEANDEILDIDECIGRECLNHFSEPEGIVYVRNDKLEIDFEVLFNDDEDWLAEHK